MFENVMAGPPDPMFDLKKLADMDTSQEKIDLGVGIYRNETGAYHELRSVKKAKKILDSLNLGHDYESTIGNAEFLRHAAKLAFGENSDALVACRVASVQTISGTGACHLGALLLRKNIAHSEPQIFIGTPAWGNYDPLFRLVGLDKIYSYTYYSQERGAVDFSHMLSTVRIAPKRSIFVLQACCHNPTGMDLTREQWAVLAQEMKARHHFPFFDMAYQGLGVSLEEDAWAVRHFASLGFEMLVCQSFSKNFGLYGERCGALHVVSDSATVALRVKDRLRSLIRWEFSSSPAYGSRLVAIIAEDDGLREDWTDELAEMQQQLRVMRSSLFTALAESRKLPGNWDIIRQTRGLFCILPLTPGQCDTLVRQHHIYLPPTGRINLSGLNSANIARFAAAIEAVLAQTWREDAEPREAARP